MKMRNGCKKIACAILAGLLIFGMLSDRMLPRAWAIGSTVETGNSGNLPEPSASPKVTEPVVDPSATEPPELTGSPKPTAVPSATGTPEPTAVPSATYPPEQTASPSATETPEPSAAGTPGPSSSPVPTAAASASPSPLPADVLPIQGINSKNNSATLELTSDFTEDEFRIGAEKKFNVTLSITGTGVEEPVVVLTVPKGITVNYFPNENDQTLGPNLADGTKVVSQTDSEGNTTLTYRFKPNITSLGFNITLLPTYKLMEKVYGITAEYFNGTTPIADRTVITKFYNSTLHLEGVYLSNSSNKQSKVMDGSAAYDMPCKIGLIGVANHYSYDSLKLEIPIPEEALPGFGEKDQYTPMEEGVAYPVEDDYGGYQVTYQSSYSYENADGSLNGSTKTLIYDFPKEHSFVSNSAILNLTGNIYLRFVNPSAQLYYNPVSGRVSADVGTETVLLQDYETHTGTWDSSYGLRYNLLFLFKEYNIKDDFNLDSMILYSEYGSYQSVLPLDQKAYNNCTIQNSTEYTLYDVKINYVLDPRAYCDKVRFFLDDSGIMPSAASVEYQTKSGAIRTEQLNVDQTILTAEPDDPITRMTVVFDHLGGTGIYVKSLLYIYNTNRDRLNNVYTSNTAQIISARCQELTEQGIGLGTDDAPYNSDSEITSGQMRLRTTDSYSPGCQVSPTSLNKGDTVTVSFNANNSSDALIKNPSYYLVMPKGFILRDFKPVKAYEGAPYTLRQKTLPDGTQLFTLKYADNQERTETYYQMHKMVFYVGPSVDTSRTYSTELPLGCYVEHEQEIFTTPKYSSADVNDYNENGRTDDYLARPGSLNSVQINSVNAISVQGLLDSTAAAGESEEQQFQYGSDGHYNLYFYNGNRSGLEPDDLEILIPLPRKDTSNQSGGISYTSRFGGILTGPAELKGDFLTDAAVEYSTDGGNGYAAAVQNYEDVTDIRIRSAEGKKFAENTDFSVHIPIRAQFPETVSEKDKAYFSPDITYRKTDGSGRESLTVKPTAMVASMTNITGTVFKDYNGNGVLDNSEANPGKSYPVELYRGNGTDGSALRTTATDEATGRYQIGFLTPGTYTLKVQKADDEYYPANSHFDREGVYTFTALEGTKPAVTDINLGIISGRTLKTNFSEVRILEGKTRQIVPDVTPRLEPGETIHYESSNPDVADVGEDGVIHFKTEGVTTVTVSVPQLTGLVNMGSEPSVSKEIKVTCQLDGCHLTTSLYFATSSSAAFENGIVELDYNYSAGTKNMYLYGLFHDSGYCNDASHAQKGIRMEITGNTCLTGQITSQYDYEKYSQFRIASTGAGNIALKIFDNRGHANGAQPVTLTVHIKPKVSFQANGGTVPPGESSRYVICQEPYGELPKPTRTGYEFTGWFTEQDAGTKITGTDTVELTENQTLYAHWKTIEYEVAYEANTSDPSVTGMPDESQKKLHDVNLKLTQAQPGRTGYRFGGWNTEEDGKGTSYAAGASYQENKGVILYACWIPKTDTKYTVNHYKQNVDGVGYGQPEVENLEGTTAEQVTPAVKDYTGFTSPPPSQITIAADGSAVLDYEYTRNQYRLTAAAGEGIRETAGSAPSAYYETAMKVEAVADTGYHFKEWVSSAPSLLPGSGTAAYEFHMPAGEVILTAQAEADIYQIIYELGSGTAGGNPLSYTVETETFTLEEPVRKGYHFIGWTGSNGEEAQKNVAIEIGSTGDKNYRANWETAEYDIRYELDGGSAEGNPYTYTVETETFALLNPVKTGYTFLGWSRTIDGVPEKIMEIPQGSTGEITFFAHWSANPDTPYTVNHYLEDIDGKYVLKEREDLRGTTNTTVTPAVREYTGFTAPQPRQIVIAADGSAELNYEYDRNQYRLTRTADIGIREITGSDSSVYYDAVVTIEAVADTGYHFKEWVSSVPLLLPGSEMAAYEFHMPAGELTLTAQAEADIYQITYELENGTAEGNPLNYTVETETFSLEEPVRKGYHFVGWTGSNGEEPKKNVTVEKGSTGDKNYMANWMPVEYSMRYELDGGSAEGNPQTYTVETGTFALVNPVKTGYTFLGWSRTIDGVPEKIMEIPQGSTGEITFFAHWSSSQDTAYTVNHYLQDLEGNYVLKDREDLEGTTNASVTPAVRNYTGFTSPKAQSAVIKADGSTTVDYHYTRNSYRLTFDAAGGEGGTSMGVKYGSKLHAPQVTREGYSLDSWVPAPADTMPASDTEYRAVWASTVIYDANGGQKAPAGQVILEGGNLTGELPVYEGSLFQGWNTRADGKGKAYLAGQVYNGPGVTLYAQWSRSGYRITGKVENDEYPVTVTIMSGSRTVAVTQTDQNGRYEFHNINPGTYNIVAERPGHKTMTLLSVITDSNVEHQNIRMPREEVSSLLQVDENLPEIIVGGLDKEALRHAVPGSHMKIWLSVSENEIKKQELLEQLGSNGKMKYEPGMALDISLIRQKDKQSLEFLDESGNLLTILIPLPENLQGKSEYVIYRSHQGSIDLLTAKPNSYGEYIEVNEQKTELTVYARRFSMYAVAYLTDEHVTPEPPGHDSQPQNTASGDSRNDAADTKDDSPIGFWLLCECGALLGMAAFIASQIRKRKRYH
ncbi:InlB B-repeat-containing protein [Diplocloster hominis]|uniref:InlB B-repeat-containing protein n=1 Tax=Diplocloster hominis TaxID=3079010 RepID=UPI0031B9D686